MIGPSAGSATHAMNASDADRIITRAALAREYISNASILERLKGPVDE